MVLRIKESKRGDTRHGQRVKTENREGRNDDPCALSAGMLSPGPIVPLAAGNANFHLRSFKRGRCLLRFVLF